MKIDPFSDVRDKRMGELNDEQRDRATELWLRKQLGWMSVDDQPRYQALFRIIDRLRMEDAGPLVEPEGEQLSFDF